MKTIFAVLVLLSSVSVAEAQFYPQMSQLRQAPIRTQSRTNYGYVYQRSNQGFYFSGNNRRPTFQTVTQGRSTHVLQGSRYRGTVYRR